MGVAMKPGSFGQIGIACVLFLAAVPAAAARDDCRVGWLGDDGYVAYGVLEPVQAALDISEPQEVLKLATSIAAANPDCADAQLLLGWLEVRYLRAPEGWVGSGSLGGEEFLAVLQRFKDVLAREPGNAAAHALLGLALNSRSTDNPLLWPTVDPLPEIESYRRALDLQPSWEPIAVRLGQSVFAYYLLLGSVDDGPARSGSDGDRTYEKMRVMFADWRDEVSAAIPHLERFAWTASDSFIRVGNALVVAYAMLGDVAGLESALARYASADVQDDFEFRCTLRFLAEKNLSGGPTLQESVDLRELCPDYALAKQ